MRQEVPAQEHMLKELESLRAELEHLRAEREQQRRELGLLTAQKELLGAVLGAIPCGIYWKSAGLTYLGANPEFARALGLPSAASIIGKTDPQLAWPAELLPTLFEMDQAVLHNAAPLLNIEVNVPHADGQQRTLLLSKLPLLGAEGKILGIAGTYEDITGRRRAETALRESEDRFRRLVEQATDSFFVYALDGRILDANQSACAQFGIAYENLLRKNIAAFEQLFLDANFEQQYAQAREAGVLTVVGMHRRRDGTTFPVEARISAIEFNGQPALLALARDITERVAAEEALRESERRYRQVVENASDIIYTTDARGTYTYANMAALSAAEYTAQELYTKSYLDLVLPEHRKRVSKVYQRQYLKRQRTSYVEFPFESKTGHIIWLGQLSTLIVEESRITGFHLIARNITERKRAEEKLLHAHSMLSATLESTTDGVLVVDLARKVQSTNQKFREMWHIPPDVAALDDDAALLAHVLDQIVDSKCFLERIEQLYAASETESYDVIHFKDGRIYERYSLPQRIAGQCVGRVWSFRDITQRVEAEAERERLQAQVLHAQKLESLGVLAGGIAHDFNNLLTGILGGTEYAQSLLPEDSPAAETLKQVQTSVYRAADLTRQMLAYSGRGRFVVEPLLLSEVVQDITRLIHASLSKKCILKFSFAQEEACVQADVSQMRQVVMNLLINASEAIGDAEGEINLSTGVLHCTRETFANTWLDEKLPEGRYVYLRVSDTGCGMTEQVMGKLFDPFFSTKFTGRGLGMAAVLGIVRGHHGAIKVESVLGRGSTFTLYFPASHVQKPARQTKPDYTGGPAATGALVLVVDDEAQVRRIAGRMLEKAGYKVIFAEHGVGAIAQFHASNGAIRAVLLDITMPRLGGLETLEELRKAAPNLGIVLTSGYNQEEVMRDLDQPNTWFLQKPYAKELFLDVIARAVVSSTPPQAGRKS